MTLRVFVCLFMVFPITSRAAFQDTTSLQQSSFSCYTQLTLALGTCCSLALMRLCKVDLLSAIRQGNLRSIKLFVLMGGNINSLINKQRPLVYAAQQAYTPKQITTIKYLLDQGAYIEAIDSDGNSALTAAAQGGHYWAIAALLKAGAHKEHRNKSGHTALWCAVQGACNTLDNNIRDKASYLTCIELLLKSGARIEASNFSGETPVSYARRHNDLQTIDSLISGYKKQVTLRFAQH